MVTGPVGLPKPVRLPCWSSTRKSWMVALMIFLDWNWLAVWVDWVVLASHWVSTMATARHLVRACHSIAAACATGSPHMMAAF